MVQTQELSRLPLRAIVAFAVRCASRVEPLTSELGEEAVQIVHGVIATAEGFAKGASLDKNMVDEAARAAARAADVVRSGSSRASTAGRDSANAARAAWAASETVRAAHSAARAIGVGALDAALSAAALASQVAEAADDAATAAAEVAAANAARADLSRLLELNLGGPGEIGQPIDVTETGPLGSLWPKGAPVWYLSPARQSSAPPTART
jgi:hypothetical protein